MAAGPVEFLPNTLAFLTAVWRGREKTLTPGGMEKKKKYIRTPVVGVIHRLYLEPAAVTLLHFIWNQQPLNFFTDNRRKAKVSGSEERDGGVGRRRLLELAVYLMQSGFLLMQLDNNPRLSG